MTPPERKAHLLDLGRDLVRTSAADETEVLLVEGRSFLTRFTAGRIHQNVGAEEADAVVRVVAAKRLGVATTSSLAPSALAEAREAALAIARAAEPLEDWPGLPEPRPVEDPDTHDAATADLAPDARADAAGRIMDAARAKHARAAGAVRTDDFATAVVSSTGVEVASAETRAAVHTTVVADDDGAGYAEAVASRWEDLDVKRVGQRAALKADKSRRPAALPAGRYDVVLEPAATAEWIEYLAYVAFGGKAFDEGRSPLAGRLGEPVTGADITIWDNALDRRTLPAPFDFEGMPSRRLSLITKGVAKGVATNDYRARRLGKRKSTGHALPASSRYECTPMHLFMKGGASSERRLVAETERGLLVTRFHYTNVLDPMKTVLTGMTRDGTFLIEGGEIVGPVRNFRYTENILEALARLDGAGRRLTLVQGPVVCPAIRVREVQFSGSTEF